MVESTTFLDIMQDKVRLSGFTDVVSLIWEQFKKIFTISDNIILFGNTSLLDFSIIILLFSILIPSVVVFASARGASVLEDVTSSRISSKGGKTDED